MPKSSTEVILQTLQGLPEDNQMANIPKQKQFVEKEKPAEVRSSNITAAKGAFFFRRHSNAFWKENSIC